MLSVRVNVPPVPAALEALAEGLVRLNVWYLEEFSARGADLPPLYRSGARYRREPVGQEWWESAADLVGVLTRGTGDCEDMSAFRTAELRFTGEDEDARVKIVRTSRAFHAVVQRGDGSIEDPSRILVALEARRTGRSFHDIAQRRRG